MKKKIKINVWGTDRSVEPFDNDVDRDFEFETEKELQSFLEGLHVGLGSHSLHIEEVGGKRKWEV